MTGAPPGTVVGTLVRTDLVRSTANNRLPLTILVGNKSEFSRTKPAVYCENGYVVRPSRNVYSKESYHEMKRHVYLVPCLSSRREVRNGGQPSKEFDVETRYHLSPCLGIGRSTFLDWNLKWRERERSYLVPGTRVDPQPDTTRPVLSAKFPNNVHYDPPGKRHRLSSTSFPLGQWVLTWVTALLPRERVQVDVTTGYTGKVWHGMHLGQRSRKSFINNSRETQSPDHDLRRCLRGRDHLISFDH